ncbi:MAG: ATP-binding protein, partial [Caldilineae bacterium]
MQAPPERLGSFYLGAEYDLKTGQRTNTPVNYDARDLTTHAVCVGMTGSGKTGLCIGLLEEAALDNVPTLIIDPKGDMTNLLLQFPDLRPEDFEPWVNPDDARRKGKTIAEYAADIASLWRNGHADWGITPDRIRALKEGAEFTIYTPGSDAGIPISILGSLAAPPLDFEQHAEAIRERIGGTVAALLGLVGVKADPVRSREAILLSNLFEHFWRQGEDLDLAKLIMAVQNPPVRQLGVFDVDTFYPEKDRFELAMAFNNLVAAPAFKAWLEGEPLDIDALLYAPDGKPRHSIFYIAHLSDSERMFFVTLLLENVLTWVRAQTGTTSLRAILYFDEIFGFFPPTAEPPSKRPLLTLLKQARAFGLGVVLVTQNPVDLDYKGLTNAGTWFIGKLQAERDKDRVLQGLKGAIAEAGGKSKVDYDELISRLGSRVFLLHNVHEDRPVVFYTRWVMSYLRGPMTRPQVQQLMADRKQAMQAAPSAAPRPAARRV